MTYELRAPATDAEWEAYHAIRRHVLFERRGRGDAYDPAHPDEVRAGNYPLVLFHFGEPLGVIRVDISAEAAVFRRVAIREDVQRRGHGRHLLSQAERFAQSHGCQRIDSHVDAAAVGFYERCGFARANTATVDGGAVLMTKSLR